MGPGFDDATIGKRPGNAMECALAILNGEHRAFDAALAAIVDRIRLVRAHRAAPEPESFRRAISYIATFMDHFHHPKEDEFLFKAVRRRTRAADSLIERLQHEHTQAPGIFAELMKSLTAIDQAQAAFEDFAHLFERYAASQVEHMALEGTQVLPIARGALRLSDWIEIEAAFAANRDPLFSALASEGLLAKVAPR